MTEEQWLASTDPTAMLEHLEHSRTFSKRKATLLMAGACRQVPAMLANDGSRIAVEAVRGCLAVDLLLGKE
jgi:hypothetical protein